MQLIEEREGLVLGAWSPLRWAGEVEGWVSPIVYSTCYTADIVSTTNNDGWAVLASSPATTHEKQGFR